MSEEKNEAVSQSQSQSQKKPDETKLFFDNSPVTNEIGFNGVKIDFNFGCRIMIPEGERKINVRIMDADARTILYDQPISGAIVTTDKKYYINYSITLTDVETKETFVYNMDLKDKIVIIRFPQSVMGDVLAWFPYADEFRKKHHCNLYVSVSPVMEKLFAPEYPEIHFLHGEERPIGTYATYYMGIFFPTTNRDFQKIDFRYTGLQKNIPYILDLPPVERSAKIHVEGDRPISEPYVCIAVQSTTQCKMWNNPGGWIETIKFLKEQGYRVLCIDRNNVQGVGRYVTTIPFGCEDFTGDVSLNERARYLKYADFFVGVSSGLAWLAWSVGCPVVMVSGFTLPMNEFENPYRVINYNACNGCWHYEEFKHDDYGWCPKFKGSDREFECSRLIGSELVINTIKRLMNDKELNPSKNNS